MSAVWLRAFDQPQHVRPPPPPPYTATRYYVNAVGIALINILIRTSFDSRRPRRRFALRAGGRGNGRFLLDCCRLINRKTVRGCSRNENFKELMRALRHAMEFKSAKCGGSPKCVLYALLFVFNFVFQLIVQINQMFYISTKVCAFKIDF